MIKHRLIFLILPLCCLWSSTAFSVEAGNPILSIGGIVQSPMQLSLPDLQKFNPVKVLARPKAGAKVTIRYGTVPLRNLIELAKMQKPFQGLAISVKNHQGEQTVLSWGEVFLAGRDRIFVAHSVNAGASAPYQDLPALILERDKKASLFLGKITFIEVIQTAHFQSGPAYSRKAVTSESVRGRMLESVLEKMAIKLEQTDILRITSADGKAVILSIGDLESRAAPAVISRPGNRSDETSYDLVFPGDASKARTLEKIAFIDVVSLIQKPMLYVIGVGCGDPNLLTNEAISAMGRSDAFIGKEDYQKSFAGYIAGRPVLFDPFMQLARYQKARHPEFTEQEAEKTANAVYADNIETVRKLLKENRIIGLLEPGDPTLYGGWRNWLSEYIPQDQIKIIPGMSSFSVANAILGEFDLTDNPLVIVEPEDLKANDALLQAAAQNGHTLVVFMGLNRMKSLIPSLSRHFPPDTPLFVVYYAGIAGQEHRLSTTISKAIDATDAEKENFIGLIYVGRELKTSSQAPR